eukprot:gb/GEZJ01007013.1/.p1 GENE.gb/GEZJ01007013.1/~~gb/GEZJ01007013.1/.p1  ORF type:complete len:223 (+),score=36.07 gb/GEZJ01007013.1/:71-670(+)
MRPAVGELELDPLFHSRKHVNQRVSDAVTDAAFNWGLVVTQHEILDVKPDKHILEAIDKQAAAERMRREKVPEVEGAKQAAALQSEGVRIRLENESQGHLLRVRNEARAEESKLRIVAERKARAIELESVARGEALREMAKAFGERGAMEAAKFAVALEFVDMYGQMGKGSNALIVNERPAHVGALLAQVAPAMHVRKD